MILKNLLSMSGVNIVKSVVQFLMTLLMTYFVTPAEFGLVAFSLPFVAFIALLTDLGLSSAMIQRGSLSREETGAAVTMMLAIGIGCAVVLAVVAGPLAGAVKMDGLSGVLTALSVSVVLSIAALGPRAVLERALRYQTVAMVEAGASITAASVGVLGAVLGWGIWALISYYVLMQIIRAIAFYAITRHQIRLNFRWRGVGSMLSFGSWILASNILNFAARNIGNLLIGAKLGAAAVGLFGLAFQFMIFPLMILSWPGGGVLMATLSRMSGNGRHAEQNAAICAMLSVTAMITFPAMIYLTFGLYYPVTTFLSPHWQDVLPLVSALAPAGAAQSIAAYAGPILLARGKARLQFWISSANSIAMILSFAVALPFGLKAVAIVYLVTAIIVCTFMLVVGSRNTGLPFMSIVKSLLPASIATLAGTVVALAATSADVSSMKHWLLATSLYLVVVLSCYVAFRHQIRGSVRSLLGRSIEAQPLDVPSAT
ncbi:lipopolysaccharide biosynthesis protein [Bradyrhizobium sp. AUGA SZCCT0160]|uniref:lipopolysaccharide biosynthesis protein n=1 Tax=Bradyrhizobium sp. AUGA SZCCT0160 TaxID=2807662 RepID=UPI001BA8A13D|nr:lipopolysaccharide biosynthesis protein [Bradyrhizobium sp. AUGA SZCCT0160]MBR1194040.1 lipopolysaccharide biosynthesis protein [Bradyrhizobium sp. AUGA SZCCT0160]